MGGVTPNAGGCELRTPGRESGAWPVPCGTGSDRGESGNFTYPDGASDDDDEGDEIAEDFASGERSLTERGNVRLAAAGGNRTHGDYFWSAALTVRAASATGPTETAMAPA